MLPPRENLVTLGQVKDALNKRDQKIDELYKNVISSDEKSSLVNLIYDVLFTDKNILEKWNIFTSVWGNPSEDGETDIAWTLISITLTLNTTETSVDTQTSTLIESVIGTYSGSNGNTKTQAITDYTISPITIAAGNNSVKVFYNGKTSNAITVIGNTTQPRVYGVDLTWEKPNYNKWSANGNWFKVSYLASESTVQTENGFKLNKQYSKPIDGRKYKYFRIPAETENSQYAIVNNVSIYGSDSQNALTEAGHQITECTKVRQFVLADFDQSRNSEGFVIVYPSENFDYYYIFYQTNNSLTETFPSLLGVFDAGILENPLAKATE